MHAAYIVGWVAPCSSVFCCGCREQDHVRRADAVAHGQPVEPEDHPIFCANEGWEEFTCEGCMQAFGDIYS